MIKLIYYSSSNLKILKAQNSVALLIWALNESILLHNTVL